MISLLIVACVAVAPALVTPLRRRIFRALVGARDRVAERARLRLAASLLDLGNHLMLCNEERRARRIRWRIGRSVGRGRDPVEALRRFGGSWTDEVTFEAPIGSRPQEGNPARTLRLSCTVSRPPIDALGPKDREPVVAWRVTTRPSEGRNGPVSYSEIPDLERALLAYYAPVPLKPASGGRYHDEGHHAPARPAA